MLSLITYQVLGIAILSGGIALIGAILSLKDSSTYIETATHSMFPGMIIGALISSCMKYSVDSYAFYSLIFIFSQMTMLSGWIISKYIKGMSNDAINSFILSLFFGIGTLITFIAQNRFPLLLRIVNSFLYGRMSLISKIDLYIYLLILFLLLCFIFFYINHIKCICLDRNFYNSCDSKIFYIDMLINVISNIYIILGIGTMGLILTSGSMVIPSMCARLFCSSCVSLLLSSFIIGFMFSITPILFVYKFIDSNYYHHISLPSIIALFSLFSFVIVVLIGPRSNSFISKAFRRFKFKMQIAREDILKNIYILSSKKMEVKISKDVIFPIIKENVVIINISVFYLRYYKLINYHSIDNKILFSLTKEGYKIAERLEKKHIAIEKYIDSNMNMTKKESHNLAERLEHISIDEEGISK